MPNRLAALAIVAASATTAHADVEVVMRVIPPQGADAPRIEATLIGAPVLPTSSYTVRAADGAGVEYQAVGRRDFAHGDETIAIAIVMSGQEVWIGNEEMIRDESDPSRYPGALHGLAKAIDALHLGSLAPPGSQGMVVTYADKASIRVPLGPLANITGASLGTERDYFAALGNSLVNGIELAMIELGRTPTAHKLLIVIGDGNDTDNDRAKTTLRELKKEAAQQGIQTAAIVYRSALSENGDVISTMIGSPHRVAEAAAMTTALRTIIARATAHQYLTFPGYDPVTRTGLPWDGEPHDLIVRIGRDDADPVTLAMVPTWSPPRPASVPRFVSILLAIFLAGAWFVGLPRLAR